MEQEWHVHSQGRGADGAGVVEASDISISCIVDVVEAPIRVLQD